MFKLFGMRTVFLLAAGVVACIAAAPTPADDGDTAEPLGKTELRRLVSESLRDEAVARRLPQSMRVGPTGQLDAKYSAAVLRLCDLHADLRGDSRYGDSEMLQKQGHTIRNRLLDVAGHLEAQLQRASVERPEWLVTTVTAIRRPQASESGPRAVSLTESPIEGPAVSPSEAGEGHAGGGAMDNGWQLVELIQQTISPDFWDTNGGPGTIYYYSLKRALVVRATSEIHGTVGNTLRQLQRN